MEFLNIKVSSKKRNKAIDDAMKKNRTLKDVLCAIYLSGHNDALNEIKQSIAYQQSSIREQIKSVK